MADPGSFDEEPRGVLVTGKVMVASIILLFAVVVFVMLLHLYARWFWGTGGRVSRSRRRRFVFTTDQDPVRVQRRGLDPAVIRSLPVFDFQAKSHEDGLECAVCLSEFEDGEKARLLPACRHSFHVDCIDMWFHSHSTCPLCRTVVKVEPTVVATSTSEGEVRISIAVASTEGGADQSHAAEEVRTTGDEGFSFPTNVLFWGNHSRMDSGCSAANCEEGTSSCKPHSSISIDIPPRGVLALNSPRGELLNSARMVDDEFGGISPGGLSMKSPNTRMRALRRLLSRDKRPVTCGSPSGDRSMEEKVSADSLKTTSSSV
ncbi:RING-H2 finger protein [Nymphaea thermarum]|nr:RING-H2 finger protein [Nymphaea thermarum]